MTLDSIGRLLQSICVHWPNAKKNLVNDKTGNISKAVAEEWYKRIGFLDDERADEMLEAYLCNEEVNKYPPGVPYFLGRKTTRGSKAYTAPFEAVKDLRYRVNRYGELMDSEGRIYADPDDPEGAFYLNTFGNICKRDADGREIVWIR